MSGDTSSEIDKPLWVGTGPNRLAVTIANQLIRAFPNELEDVLQSTAETTGRAISADSAAISLSGAAPDERRHIAWHAEPHEGDLCPRFAAALNAAEPANKSLRVPNLSKWSGTGEYVALAKEAGLQAFISTPLVAQGDCIGRYVVGWNHPVDFDPNHIRFARFVAQVTSSAIDRVRVSRMKLRQRSLDELLTNTSADFAYVPLDRIARQIGVTLRNVCRTLHLDFATAVVFEDPTTRAPLELGRCAKGPEQDTRANYFLSPGYTLRHGVKKLKPFEASTRLALHTLLEVPLVNEGRAFGVVIFACEAKVDWNSQERRTLGFVAEVMGRSWIQSRGQAELERTERAFEAIDDGLWEWLDVSHNQQWWSSRMYSLLGYARDTPATADAMYARIHPEDLPRLKAESLDCLGSEETLHIDVRHIDGYWLRFRGRPIEGHGNGLAGSLQDISKERNADARLVHAQKMETVGVLAGGIAHDFNNLLTAFTNCTRLAMEDIAEGRGGEAQERLGEALEVTDRAAALTRQLLTFSRRQTIQSRSFDFGELITNIIKLLRRLLPESIAIHWASPGETLPLHGDPGQLEQVIVNLCVNAGDAMPNGGSLELRASSYSLTASKGAEYGLPQGAYVRLTIGDTGRGMPPEVALRATEPFYTTKKKGEGTGLGLSTAYGIVDQHDGLLSVESEVGNGTTISVFLPRGPELAKSAATTDAPKPKPAGGSEHILVVEDDEMVLRTVVRILRRAGYEVSVARNGRVAIDLFEENPDRYQLAFLDVIMPEMDGSEACRQMLEVRPNLKFLFSTGYAAGMLDEALQGDRTLLAKPYAATDLLQKIRGLLDDQP